MRARVLLELDENAKRFRWTGKTARIVARPNGPVVGMVVSDPFAPARQGSFRVTIEGVGEAVLTPRTTEPQTVEFRMPEPLPPKFRMTITADRVINLARDANAPDDRDFGLRILATNFGLLNQD